MPLYVFAGHHLLTAWLRPSRIDPAHHSRVILKLLVDRLRQAWPKVRIVMRADGGFCRWRTMSWCDRNRVGYILGLPKNSRLEALTKNTTVEAKTVYSENQQKQRRFDEFDYAAGTWDRKRRVIARVMYGEKGSDARFVVTNLEGDRTDLYEKLYCQRGEMENRLKEQQTYLFADRTSCHQWWPNQFRLLLSSLAYVLVHAIREIGLQATEMSRAQAVTIRLKLFKIGAVITRNTRRIRFHLSSGCPNQELFYLVAARLKPG